MHRAQKRLLQRFSTNCPTLLKAFPSRFQAPDPDQQSINIIVL